MPQRLTICTTCKFSKESAFDQNGQTGGELLLAKLQELKNRSGADLEIVGHECLWACKHSCAALLEDPERTGYLAGHFEPTTEDAHSLLDWCIAHDNTKDGNVPFINWPQGMRGHFIARIPAHSEGKKS